MKNALKRFLILLLVLCVLFGAYAFISREKPLELGDTLSAKEFDVVVSRVELSKQVSTETEDYGLPTDRKTGVKQAPEGSLMVSVVYTLENNTDREISLKYKTISELRDNAGNVAEADPYHGDTDYYYNETEQKWKPFASLDKLPKGAAPVKCVANFDVPESFGEKDSHPLKLKLMTALYENYVYVID